MRAGDATAMAEAGATPKLVMGTGRPGGSRLYGSATFAKIRLFYMLSSYPAHHITMSATMWNIKSDFQSPPFNPKKNLPSLPFFLLAY